MPHAPATNAVLVTGGAGYIGAHTCKALALAGYLPVALDHLSTGHPDFVRWGPLVTADIRDKPAVAAALAHYQPSAIIHFAACAYVRESMADPEKYYDNNVAGALALLSAARAAGCHNIVFSSTCAVYGEPDRLPISEASPLLPLNPYGASKLMVERMLADFGAAYGTRAICLRYFNACGADAEGELGEKRDPETHLIARALMSLQGHIADFSVFGTEFDTPDGTAIRDYIHVADLADAHVAALRALLAGGASQTLNLGTGQGHSVKQVLDMIETVTGQPLPRMRGGRQPGDPARLVADPRLAREVLGFTPSRSDLETIIRSAWRWHQAAHPRR